MGESALLSEMARKGPRTATDARVSASPGRCDLLVGLRVAQLVSRMAGIEARGKVLLGRIRIGDAKGSRSLVQAEPTVVEYRDARNTSLLAHAALCGRPGAPEIAKLILHHAENPHLLAEEVDERGYAPLFYCMQQRHKCTVSNPLGSYTPEACNHLEFALVLVGYTNQTRRGVLDPWERMKRSGEETVVSSFVRFMRDGSHRGGLWQLRLQLANRWLRRVQHVRKGLEARLPRDLALQVAVQAVCCWAGFWSSDDGKEQWALRAMDVCGSESEERDVQLAVRCAEEHLTDGRKLCTSSALTNGLLLSFAKRCSRHSCVSYPSSTIDECAGR